MTSYQEFLERKTHTTGDFGFEPLWMPKEIYPFQSALVTWGLRKGRAATFADCGLGKTVVQLTWAENVARHTGRPVLILTPLAVGPQTAREGEKFGIEAKVSRDGSIPCQITLTNYERLHYFKPDDFAGVACDESSILKNFDGATKAAVTDFMRKIPYRSLYTATAAPNDYIELGTSSEALGHLGYIEMLQKFFKSDSNTFTHGGGPGFHHRQSFGKFRFRGHAERDFWRWICSWARAIRSPADLGFTNNGFVLPELKTCEHVVQARTPREDMLFDLPAVNLHEQRAERRRTLNERCEIAAKLICSHDKPAVAWCHLNDEGHLLEKLIPGAVEVEGNDSDDFKEETFEAFAAGQIRVLVSKPVIAGFGLNWQHCAHQTFFPSHSFEQWYQAIRRSWRFGQKNSVQVDVITSEGERNVLSNLQRKAHAAERMFEQLVQFMNQELRIKPENLYTKKMEVPEWLS